MSQYYFGEKIALHSTDDTFKLISQNISGHFDDRLGLGIEEKIRYDKKEKHSLPVKEKLLSDRLVHLVPREHFDHKSYAKKGFKLEVPVNLYHYGEIYGLCIVKGTSPPKSILTKIFSGSF